MTIEKKTIRSDIPGHQALLNPNMPNMDEQRRLVVSRDVSIEGSIGSCNNLSVEGSVIVTDFAGRRLEVADTGSFTGAAKVSEAVIAGQFTGSLIVSGRLTVKGSGRIRGDVSYGALEVETGAVIEGKVAQVLAEQKALLPHNVEKLFDEEDAAEEQHKGPRVFRRAVGL